MTHTTLLLTRHGETVDNVNQIMQGQTPGQLTAHGRQQAEEVAQRLAAGPGSKTYGILSVLLQAWYDIEYLFTVDENVFNPPPKVKSGVIRMVRNKVTDLGCNERLFKTVVKTAFGQRRKMLRGSLKGMFPKDHPALKDPFFMLSPLSFIAFPLISIAAEPGVQFTVSAA